MSIAHHDEDDDVQARDIDDIDDGEGACDEHACDDDEAEEEKQKD